MSSVNDVETLMTRDIRSGINRSYQFAGNLSEELKNRKCMPLTTMGCCVASLLLLLPSGD